jgi:anti-sigma B factor antagonist
MTGPLARVTVDRGADRRTVATVAGEIDLTNAGQVDRQLGLAADGSAELVVDLTDVTYLDSQGVRILQHLAQRHRGGALRVTVITGRRGVVRELLEITRLGDVVTVVPEEPSRGWREAADG